MDFMMKIERNKRDFCIKLSRDSSYIHVIQIYNFLTF